MTPIFHYSNIPILQYPPPPPLFVANILAEVVGRRKATLEVPRYLLPIPAAAKGLLQKSENHRPGVFGRFFAVPSRHGVIEPTVRRVRVKPYVIGFLVLLKARAEFHHGVNRDAMIGLAKRSQHGSGKVTDQTFQRFLPAFVDAPTFAAHGAIKDNAGGNVFSMRLQQNGVAPGRAHTHNGDARSVHGLTVFQPVEDLAQILQDFIVAQPHSDLSRKQTLSVARKTPKKIRRQTNVSSLREL